MIIVATNDGMGLSDLTSDLPVLIACKRLKSQGPDGLPA
ncbi:hypothetical protein ACVW16_000173 [Bradyrhizobium sp. USDA 4474]